MAPEVTHIIVADFVRPEPGNKSTVIGYMGHLPLAKISMDIGAPTTLAFLIVLAPGSGAYELRMLMTSPSGVPVLDSTGSVVLTEEGSSNVVVNLVGLKLPEYGSYRFEVLDSAVPRFGASLEVVPRPFISDSTDHGAIPLESPKS